MIRINKKSLSAQDTLPISARLCIYAILIFVVVSMGIPMVNVLAVSLSTATKSEAPGLVLLPNPITFEGYMTIWSHADLWRPFINTAFVAVAGTLLHVFLSSLTGFVLLHKELPGRHIMTTFVMLTMTVPGELTLVSLYEVNKELGLLNTYAALIINGAASGFSILLMRNYFSSIPASLPEAAQIEGAGYFTIFRKIFIPLAIPGIMTIGTLNLIGRWNNITVVVSLISDMKMWTLPVILRQILFDSGSTSGTMYIFQNAKMAAVAITAVPLAILYFITQKFFGKGVMLGATKE